MMEGSIDILSPELCFPGESLYGGPKDYWLASYAKTCATSKLESKAEECCVFFECLARSKCLSQEGPEALKRAFQQTTFGKDSNNGARWIARACLEASKSKVMHPPELNRYGEVEAPALYAWLEAFSLRSLPEMSTASPAKKRIASL